MHIGNTKAIVYIFSLLVCMCVTLGCDQLARKDDFSKQTQQIDTLLAKSKTNITLNRLEKEYLLQKAYQQSKEISYQQGIARAGIEMGKIASNKGDINSAVKLFTEASNLSLNSEGQKEKIQAQIELGIIAYNKGEFEQSITIFTSSLASLKHNIDEESEAKILYYMGKYHHTQGDYAQSISMYEKARRIAVKSNNDPLLANILLSIGKYLLNDGNTNGALVKYLEAYRLGEKMHDDLLIANSCNHLGSIFLILRHYDQAIKYHRIALAIRKQMNNPGGMAKSHNNIGETFLMMNQPDSALFHFNRSLKRCIETSYLKGMVKAQINIARVYEKTHQPSQALSITNNALQKAQEANYEEGQADAYLLKGHLYLNNGEPEKAVESYKNSLKRGKASNLSEIITSSYDGLYKSYQAQNNYREALLYLQQYSDAQITRIKSDSDRQLAELHILFESEKREKDNVMLRQQNNLQEILISKKNQVIAFITIVLLLTALLGGTYYSRFIQKRKAHRYEKVLNNELEAAISERDKVMFIIAHELRNPLYWFQNLAEVLSMRFHEMPSDKIKKSLDSLDESAKNTFHLMDNLLYWSRSRLNRINTKKEILALKQLLDKSSQMYASIIQYKQISYSVACNDEIELIADGDLLSCVIRNLLSNAIKYTPEGGIISIQCMKTSGMIKVEVSDSGVGISLEMQRLLFMDDQMVSSEGLLHEKGTGFGLKLCKEFVEKNCGEIGFNESQYGGSCFWFTVPENKQTFSS